MEFIRIWVEGHFLAVVFFFKFEHDFYCFILSGDNVNDLVLTACVFECSEVDSSLFVSFPPDFSSHVNECTIFRFFYALQEMSICFGNNLIVNQ